jgi:hypothetical protein
MISASTNFSASVVSFTISLAQPRQLVGTRGEGLDPNRTFKRDQRAQTGATSGDMRWRSDKRFG